MRRRSPVRAGATLGGALAGALAVAVAFAPAASAATVVILQLVSPAQAVAGNGWAVHPDQSGGTEQFVEGPATPPAGIGSLEFSVPDGASRALIFTVPNPGSGATAPGDIGPIIAVPWLGMVGSSLSTYTTDATNPGRSAAGLKFVGYQTYDSNNPLLSTGFTTLNFEPANNGTVAVNQWQKWTVSGSSMVWQSNTVDGNCGQGAPCTLSAFAALYPQGAWGQVQLGLGALGSGPATSSIVDDVTIAEGATTFGYDFEVQAVTTSPPAKSAAPSTSASAPFVPGAGDTGDPDPAGTTPWLPLAVAAGALALGSLAVQRRRRPGKHA